MRRIYILLAVSAFIQSVYLFTLPISFESDAGGYLSYAKLFANMGGWFQYWRPPGYPLYIHLLGVTWAQSFTGVIVANALMGIAMPLLVYGILHPAGKRTAFIAALILALSTVPFSYTKVMITEHPYSFFLLLGAFGFSRFVATKAVLWAALTCIALLTAMMMRNEAGYILGLAVLMMFAQCRDWRKAGSVAACALVAVAVIMGWSWKRAEIMREPTAFGSLHNFTGRQMFWRVYYSVGNGSLVNVRSENGPASRQLAEMFPGLLDHPSHENNWKIGQSVVERYGVIKGDDFLKQVVRETIAAHPEILIEFARSAVEYLGVNLAGPVIIWHYDVYEAMPFNIGQAAQRTMTPGLMQQYTTSYQRQSKTLATIHRAGQQAHNMLRISVGALLVLSIGFLPFTRHRWLAIFLFLTSGMLIGAAVLGFGFNVRYEHMILSFLLMTASLALVTVIESRDEKP